MSKPLALVTGANGEVGHTLIPLLSKQNYEIIAIDITNIGSDLKPFIKEFYLGTVTKSGFLRSVFDKHNFDVVFHLAALLSTSAEKEPEKAHIVNVGGTSITLRMTNEKANKLKKNIKFIFPSTIAVYGLPTLDEKANNPKVKEIDFLNPITMYGINKLYCENLGVYYTKYYKLLSTNSPKYLDFRCVRFPGLISALTVPAGGTSDFAPEMIHTAAQGKSYESFVREDSVLPFMAMPDAVKSLMVLVKSPKEKMTRFVYNVSSFSATAKEIENVVTQVFPQTSISYNPDTKRQKIVDSWPADIDDSTARKDWGWSPDYDMKKTFKDYLIPEVSSKYNPPK